MRLDIPAEQVRRLNEAMRDFRATRGVMKNEQWAALNAAVRELRTQMAVFGLDVARALARIMPSRYDRYHPRPLCIDGREYHRRRKARRRRRR